MPKKNHKESKKTRSADAESAEEVLREEIFPSRSHKCGCGCAHTKNPSEPKRGAKAFSQTGKSAPNTKSKISDGKNRPKQKGYKMIDPSDESADGGKS